MREEKQVEFLKFVELEVLVKARVLPGRDAPPCRDHDDPRFSDYGDPPEVLGVEVWLGELNVTKELSPFVLRGLEEDTVEEAEGGWGG